MRAPFRESPGWWWSGWADDPAPAEPPSMLMVDVFDPAEGLVDTQGNPLPLSRAPFGFSSRAANIGDAGAHDPSTSGSGKPSGSIR